MLAKKKNSGGRAAVPPILSCSNAIDCFDIATGSLTHLEHRLKQMAGTEFGFTTNIGLTLGLPSRKEGHYRRVSFFSSEHILETCLYCSLLLLTLDDNSFVLK